jgi:hypothetical protein
MYKNILIRTHIWDAINMKHKFRRLKNNIIMCMQMHKIFRNGKDYLEDLGIGGRIILKWTLQN